jgi:NADPH:quinone reductase-like Zn-dependent oxidoreductase
MKAFALPAYTSPSQLRLANIQRPVPADHEVLVRVRATSINPYDWHNLRGEPRVARLMSGGLGLRTPRIRVLGCDMAGEVQAVGRDVTRFRPGDEVFALMEQGGFAEYVSVAQDLLAPKPRNLSFEQAAAVPMAGVTALLAVREVGLIQADQHVLVTGASGGVGTFAVQIARAYGGKVTGVCSTRNLELVRGIGAENVIDYTVEDFTRAAKRYDLVIDIAGARPAAATRRALTPGGTFVLVGGPAGRWLEPAGRTIAALVAGRFASQRVALANVGSCTTKQQQLETLTQLLETGQVRPVIDHCVAFDQIPEALAFQEKGHAAGKVVVSLGGIGSE